MSTRKIGRTRMIRSTGVRILRLLPDALILAALLAGMLRAILPQLTGGWEAGLMLAGAVAIIVITVIRKSVLTCGVLTGLTVFLKAADYMSGDSLSTILLFSGLGLLAMRIRMRRTRAESEPALQRKVYGQQAAVALGVTLILICLLIPLYQVLISPDLDEEHGLSLPVRPMQMQQQTQQPAQTEPEQREQSYREKPLPVDPQASEQGLPVQPEMSEEPGLPGWILPMALLAAACAAGLSAAYIRMIGRPRRRLKRLERQADAHRSSEALTGKLVQTQLQLLQYLLQLHGIHLRRGQLFSDLMPAVALRISLPAEEAFASALSVWQKSVYGGEDVSAPDLQRLEQDVRTIRKEMRGSASIRQRIRYRLLGV